MPHRRITKRTFLKASAAAALWNVTARADNPPNLNFVFILADDLGFGDVGCYGSKISTPNLDRIASEGVRFRQFYSASPVCSPSRASLMTGRYPTRVAMPRVLMSFSTVGLPASETTIAQMLKPAGYRSMCIGKWHLGSQPQFLPTNRGFDEFYGIPYSNDMWPLPLMYNDQVIEQPAQINLLTQRYTDQSVQFIRRSKDGPFFLYLAHNMPHIPLGASDAFRGRSPLGPYGDAVQELDWSVGQVLQAIQDAGIEDRTLLMFSSDNGPWYQGSPGTLRGRKGETFEGGVREPFIARLPGWIPSGGLVNGVATMMDILPTLAALSGAPLPPNPVDGIDITPMLTGQADDLTRDMFLYFDAWNLQCARLGRWKLHVSRYNSVAWTPDPPGGRLNLPLRPELYDLEADPEESYDIAASNPKVVGDIRARMEASLASFPDQVRSAWFDTMRTPVDDTPSGALPVRSGG